MLLHAVEHSASDVNLQTHDYPYAEIHGVPKRLVLRKLQPDDVHRMIDFIYGSNGTSVMAAGKPIDDTYELRVNRESKMRFRANIVRGTINGEKGGYQITLRTIPGVPPRLEDLNPPQEIIDNFFPTNGLITVVGVTGSGKSTLLAAGIRYMAERGLAKKIVTYESPVEFTYANLDLNVPMPHQCEIGPGKDLPDFQTGISNAMRRAPKVIQIGEARSAEDMDALIEAATTGHATYSTLHTKTVSETFGRILQTFPHEARSGAAVRMLGAFKLIVAQKLAKTVDGKRAPVQEWLVFDREVTGALNATHFDTWPRLLAKFVWTRKTSLAHSAFALLRAGRISWDVFLDMAEWTEKDAKFVGLSQGLVTAESELPETDPSEGVPSGADRGPNAGTQDWEKVQAVLSPSPETTRALALHARGLLSLELLQEITGLAGDDLVALGVANQ